MCNHCSGIACLIINPIVEGLGTYGSRAICGSFDGCIWLPDKSLFINNFRWNQLRLREPATSIAVLTMFCSMYACEQAFSHLKNIETKLRSGLTGRSLSACMKLNLTMCQPDYKAISTTMQHQKSVALIVRNAHH